MGRVATEPAPGCDDCNAKPVDFSRLLGKIKIELRHAGEMSRMRCQLK
jgi:hypothetical protein